MGVDVVRIHARWWEIAPGRNATRAPSGFNANNPNDPQYNWAALDNAITQIRNAGLRPMVTITGPGPLWTSGDTRKRNALWKPKPAAYASFARAVATRYRDRVDRYLLWNEPNQKGWLQPQWTVRPPPPQLPAGVAAPLPLARARRASPIDPLGRSRQRGRGRRAGAGRRSADQRPDADEAADLHARARLRGHRATSSIRTGSCRGFKALQAQLVRLSPAPAEARAGQGQSGHRTRPSSPTCSGCSRRWTSSRPASGCGSAARST